MTSDHELTSAEDALEKLRAGLTLEIRGSHPYLLPDIVNALKTLPHLSSQITVCTDDVPPDMLLEKGGIIALLNLLIEHGLSATDVLRFATLNAAIRLQRNDLGLIAAGRRADLVVFDSLENLKAREVFVAGKLIARDGALLQPIAAAAGLNHRATPCKLRRLALTILFYAWRGLTTVLLAYGTFAARALPSGERSRCRFVTEKSNCLTVSA